MELIKALCALRRLVLVLVAVSAVLVVPSVGLAQELPLPVPLHKGCSAPLPPTSVCTGPPVCKENGDGTSGIWQPGPALANGSACKFTFQKFSAESKCSEGLCTAPPAGTSGWFQPRYILIGVMYAPPGNASSVSYASSSTLGTTQDVALGFGTGYSVGVTALDITTTTAETNTTTTDTSFTISKSQGTTAGVKSVNDTVDHDQDMFFIWLSPTINFSQPYASFPSLTVNLVPADPTAPDPTRKVTVAVIRGAEPDQYHVMDGWTIADRKNLLAQDPFISQSTINSVTANPTTASLGLTDPTEANPNRFTLLQEMQVQGPNNAGAEIPFGGIPITSSSSQCLKTTQTDLTTVTIGTSYSFLGIVGASASGSFTTSYASSNQACNGTSQSASLTLESSTPGTNRTIAIYFDTSFATFAFIDRTPSSTLTSVTAALGPNITGRITDSSGSPLANQQINVTFANGVTRTLFSDSNGDYTIISPPAGAMTIRSGDLVQQETAVANKAAVIPLKVVSPKVVLPLPAAPIRTATPVHTITPQAL